MSFAEARASESFKTIAWKAQFGELLDMEG